MSLANGNLVKLLIRIEERGCKLQTSQFPELLKDLVQLRDINMSYNLTAVLKNISNKKILSSSPPHFLLYYFISKIFSPVVSLWPCGLYLSRQDTLLTLSALVLPFDDFWACFLDRKYFWVAQECSHACFSSDKQSQLSWQAPKYANETTKKTGKPMTISPWLFTGFWGMLLKVKRKAIVWESMQMQNSRRHS